MTDPKPKFRAEIIAIGDEMTSGQRLDTNSQWLSQQLGDLGIEVAFHSTVGDELTDNVDVFRIAANRADIVISTGGLGPTKDDLTRQALADMAGVGLEFHQEALDRIKKIFERHKREMPENNKVQAYVPVGSTIIPNPEGTAPGVDLEYSRDGKRPSRLFSVPGVPAEMKQMWASYVENAIRSIIGETKVIHHHVVHCFGVGESQAELMVPDLVRRGREPRVGITASSATISFRITAKDETREACIAQMQETIETIRKCMGHLVYGENGTTLEEVVCARLVAETQTVSIVDFGMSGAVAKAIQTCEPSVLKKGEVRNVDQLSSSNSGAENAVAGTTETELSELAQKIEAESKADFGLVIGPIDRSEELIQLGKSHFYVALHGPGVSLCEHIRFGGHSAHREVRAVKKVLDLMRLKLG